MDNNMEFTKNEIFFSGEVFEPTWEDVNKKCDGSIKINDLSFEDIYNIATNAPTY